jgi:hypothetical protein
VNFFVQPIIKERAPHAARIPFVIVLLLIPDGVLLFACLYPQKFFISISLEFYGKFNPIIPGSRDLEILESHAIFAAPHTNFGIYTEETGALVPVKDGKVPSKYRYIEFLDPMEIPDIDIVP